MNNFGIYILTFPRDYYLAGTLINSLKQYAPDVPIMIVPGSGFDFKNHPFGDIPIMDIPQDSSSKFEYYDRKFWVFNGPFEKFLYIDSDMLCIKSFDQLLKKIEAESGPFIYVSLEQELCTPESSKSAKALLAANRFLQGGQFGNMENIKKFDPSYDVYLKPMFNSGLFASSRNTISVSDLMHLYGKEGHFYADVLNKEFTGRSMDLFFGDQGKLNYLVNKKDVAVKSLSPYGFMWGGKPIRLNADGSHEEYSFIHWAGCPRPSVSLFTKGFLFKLFKYIYQGECYDDLKNERAVPGLAVWMKFNNDHSFLNRVRFTCYDCKRVSKNLAYKIVLVFKKLKNSI